MKKENQKKHQIEAASNLIPLNTNRINKHLLMPLNTSLKLKNKLKFKQKQSKNKENKCFISSINCNHKSAHLLIKTKNSNSNTLEAAVTEKAEININPIIIYKLTQSCQP